MPEIVGNISEWILQPGYPEIKGELNNEMITEVYIAPWNLRWENIPEYGALKEEGALKAYFRSFTMNPEQGLAKITLEWGATNFDPASGVDSDTAEYSMNNVELNIPIESHPNYLANWNHDFILRKGVDWNNTSAYDTVIKNAKTIEGTEEYYWVKHGDQIDSKDLKYRSASKPGVETYSIFVPEVHEETRYSSRKKCKTKVLNDGKRIAPNETFGLSKDTSHWLQSGTTVTREGRYWVAATTYRYSKDVDKDIYE